MTRANSSLTFPLRLFLIALLLTAPAFAQADLNGYWTSSSQAPPETSDTPTSSSASAETPSTASSSDILMNT